MARQIIIDKDILGWGDEHEKELNGKYEQVLQVGKHSDLPQRNTDETNAIYCKQNNCDLLTGDRTAHLQFFKAGIKKVTISQYDYWHKGDKPIYLIQIND